MANGQFSITVSLCQAHSFHKMKQSNLTIASHVKSPFDTLFIGIVDLQANGQLASLSWEYYTAGPDHTPLHTVVCKGSFNSLA
jgi:hypothetical protein